MRRNGDARRAQASAIAARSPSPSLACRLLLAGSTLELGEQHEIKSLQAPAREPSSSGRNATLHRSLPGRLAPPGHEAPATFSRVDDKGSLFAKRDRRTRPRRLDERVLARTRRAAAAFATAPGLRSAAAVGATAVSSSRPRSQRVVGRVLAGARRAPASIAAAARVLGAAAGRTAAPHGAANAGRRVARAGQSPSASPQRHMI